MVRSRSAVVPRPAPSATGNVIAGDLDLPSLGAGFAWDVSAFKTYGLGVVVPEPGRVLLLLFGLLALVFRRRRGI
jgi:hypothetical protein